MKWRLFFSSILLVVIILFSGCKGENQNPNIVIILADDLGFGDPQVYNSESKIPTPNIDLLASEGMRFTDAHSPSSVCSPTQYGLLSGRYAWRTEMKKGVLWMWDKPLISTDRLTFPKMLKTKNYATACIGKWHLGWRWPSNQDEGYMNDSIPIGDYAYEGRNQLWEKIDFSKDLGGGPLEAGFDYYFGDDVPNFAPYTFFENNKLVKIPDLIKPSDMYGGPGPMSAGWDLSRVMPEITKRAVKYIEEQSQKDNPFFLYFTLTAPHTPIAPEEQFKGKSEAGLYGDFVHEVDWSVGQIIEALKKSGDGTFAIRKGDWKLILGKDSGGFSKSLDIEGIPSEKEGQLYNLSNDPSEQNNLYTDNLDKIEELTALLDNYKTVGYSNR